MKVISDSAISTYLLENLTKTTIVDIYVPLLVAGLENFQQYPEAVPERTVKTSTTPDSDTTHLFMPCILPHTVGVKVVSGGPSNSAKGLGFQGSVSVLDEYSGELSAVINAKTLTAFRTALATSVSMVKVFDPDSEHEDLKMLSVFGAGPQAFWHVIVATRLYPNLTQVNIISRSKKSAEKLAESLCKVISQNILAFSADSIELEPHIRQSSLIFGCTPSTEAIIKRSYINTDGKRRIFISLIGSYKPHMIELDLAYLNEYYTGKTTKIIVDSRTHCLSEAGELIQGQISIKQLVSLTEFYKDGSVERVENESGVVLQKLVGLSVMDIVVAKYFAENVAGHEISEF